MLKQKITKLEDFIASDSTNNLMQEPQPHAPVTTQEDLELMDETSVQMLAQKHLRTQALKLDN